MSFAPTPKLHGRRATVLAVLALLAAPSCRCGGGDGDGEHSDHAHDRADGATLDRSSDADASADDPTAVELADLDGEGPTGEASTRFRDAGPQVEAELDGPPDPACRGGTELPLAAVVVDPRCATDLAHARKLRARLEREDGGLSLRQEASVVEQGNLRLRLINTGPVSVTLPVSFHGKLPAFSVLAEDEHHTIYELEPPQLPLVDPGQGSRTHLARMLLAPGGSAVAVITVDPKIAKVLARGAGDPCKKATTADGGDAGTCNGDRLGKGRYVLHVGELLTDVEAGDPARVVWDLP